MSSSQKKHVAVLAAHVRHLIEPHLPPSVEVQWYDGPDEAMRLSPKAEIGWFDFWEGGSSAEKVVLAATAMRWLFTISAGIERLPLAALTERGVRLSNGVGLSASAVAEYAVMGVLVAAKGFADVVRAQDRREWLMYSPNNQELDGSRALIVGYGAIGQHIGTRLKSFGVDVIGVRSKADLANGIWGPKDWQSKVGEFDWIVVAAPSTPETAALVGRAEIAGMKPKAWIFNVGRGPLIAREPLLEALQAKRIGGAFLDVTDPEPLDANDPLWGAPNTIITMHLSGRAQNRIFERASQLFLKNLDRYLRGEKLQNEIDLKRGY